MKGWGDFFDALSIMTARGEVVRAICIGEGDRSELDESIRRRGLDDVICWLGPRTDLRPVYSALDVLVSSSRYGEGFPNVVAEAMACEVPCVVTDVGDSAMLVDATGRIVPPGEPEALAVAVSELLARSDLAALGRAARTRVGARFAVERMIDETEACLMGNGR
jgi:glycosyltransferase involved in cell wall biosynthesis